jgi:hypothetical protein
VATSQLASACRSAWTCRRARNTGSCHGYAQIMRICVAVYKL